MNGTRNHEVGEYLRRLQREMSDIPSQRRDEILAEIEEHINERLAEVPDAGEADVRNVLERIGDPEDIAADARDRLGVATSSPKRMSKRTKRIVAIVVAVVVGIPLIITVLGAVAVFGSRFESGPRRLITEQQFERVRLGDDKSAVIGFLGGQGERGSLVSGLVDLDDTRLEEVPSDVPDQQYTECWLYSVTGSGTGSQAGVCFVADEVVYKRIETPK